MSCSLKTHNVRKENILITECVYLEIYRTVADVDMEIFWELYNLFPELRERLQYKGCVGQKAYNRFLRDISFVEPPWGHISETVKEMVSRSEKYQVRTYTYFNDIYLVCEPGKDTVETLLDLFDQKSMENAEKYERTFRYKLFEREMEAKRKEAEERRKIVEGWMEEEKMKIRFFKFFKYRKAKKINSSDSYSNRVITYAHEWAVGMQRALREGKEMSEVAEEISHFVDYDGITGYMYGRAASFIAFFWKHGKEFRKWFNLYNQIGDEGEKANKKRNRILNPAILSVSLGGD
jgi:hypothetical protein